MTSKTQQTWEAFRDKQLAIARTALSGLGYSLESEQPHIKGERFLMQSIGTQGGKKLILLGIRNSNGKRVVIKITDDPSGKKEIEHERKCRNALSTIKFAYEIFHTPQELYRGDIEGTLITIQEFIEQEIPFLDRPIQEQFAIALRAFSMQESAHAATRNNARIAQRIFGWRESEEYLRLFTEHQRTIESIVTETQLQGLLRDAGDRLEKGAVDIARYCGFLTHTDFVPHNFRVFGERIYLLDFSSLVFGNKHEGWARFVNFMELYNPELASAILKYFLENRSPEESASLNLMRIYRLSEIIRFYASASTCTEGNLRELEERRIVFWSEVLKSVLTGRALDPTIRASYIHERDRLRSDEEKQRQIGLH